MNRRIFLAVGGTVALGELAGCLGGDAGGDNGYGPEPGTEPDAKSIDTSSYQTQVFEGFEGIEVPLAPIEDVFYWYQRHEARIADARGSSQYEKSHIAGAVLSTAPPYTPDGDPVADWSKSERIVTYCGCPHHLSGLRAAKLIEDGYEEVYALDDGFGAWLDRDYPIEGANVSADRATYTIQGQSDPAYAGSLVRLEQLDADRLEAAPIADDGSYTLQLHYAGATDSRFRVDAPEYTVEGTLEELTSTTVTP
ncbi:rhodanese-like domain-containing protein [Haloterrigena sp. H1]|uniref:rhodanese-like domain-containing protein n=1 Tax=Haloterrigena sp. H1 TaxID=2552943 RepID=UPI00110EF192|nr:rhodanese-like domain-containing protein [Haloterrigena sp. H1]TMT80213.1 rhodanese-like domain-containing protein [Haloterrigena sp. H1]TMT85092.1 rhodanese-like domain-containing protein [Haloterrigena sp. H1]